MDWLYYLRSLVVNLALYGRLTVWVRVAPGEYWSERADVWSRRGFCAFDTDGSVTVTLKPHRKWWEPAR